jgi:hypothetical protein
MRFAHLFAIGSCAVLLASALGCSDTPPPPQKGGFTVEFSQGSSGMCNLQPHNGDVGMVSADNADGVVTDGQGDASIDCEVKGSGSFNVSATAISNGTSLHVTIPSISTKATATDPAKGSASFASANTSGTTFSNPGDTPCDFWFEGGTNQTVASGKIWASFACDEVQDNSQHTCALTQGVLVFENCATGSSG